MYCRTCGNKINDNAEICVKCGCKPLVGKSYCQSCGAKTNPQQQKCSKCSATLKSVMTTSQKKKVIEKKGLKLLGNILIFIGALCFIGMILNIIVGLTDGNSYYAMQRGVYAARCFKLGIIPFVLGIICKKCSKKKK